MSRGNMDLLYLFDLMRFRTVNQLPRHPETLNEDLFAGAGKAIAWSVDDTLTVRIVHLRSLTIKTPGRDRVGPDEMQRIVDAIAAGDGDAAAAITHIRAASAMAQKLLEDRGAV